MELIKHESIDKVLAVLHDNLEDCIYMYIDISKYGIDNPNLKVWTNDDYSVIVMRYYGSISIYAADDANLDGVVDIINEEKVCTMSGKRSVIERLSEQLADDYDTEYGYVFEFKNYDEIENDLNIETATVDDMHDIAALICRNKYFSGMYDLENLASQLAERLETGMGRNYVVRDGDKIIAHIASYAEYENIATTSGLAVDEEYENGIFMRVLEAYLVNRLWEDGFTVYTFITSKLRKRYLSILKNDLVSEYGKLVKKG